MRYERKFTSENQIKDSLYYYLYDINFREAYPSRNITSIYYDTHDFLLYNISEEGISDRSKIRLRFYNQNTDKVIIEYKLKASDQGWKTYSDLSIKENCFHILNLPKPKFNYNNKICIPKSIDAYYLPTLLVMYKRNYFISPEGTIRITLDYEIEYARVREANIYLNNPIGIKTYINVVEIKYNAEISEPEIINKVSDKLNLTLSRFSKYCNGIQTCF